MPFIQNIVRQNIMMTNKKYSLVISSCDDYEDMWNPFFTLLKKNWPEINCKIYLCTDSKNFTFDGLKIESPLNYKNHSKSWSKKLMNLLKIIDCEYIIFILDDFWLKQKVNTTLIDKCIEYLEDDKRNGFFCLISQSNATKPSNYTEFNMYEKNAPFRITTQSGIWRKSFLEKILRGHESAWMFETRGSWRSKFMKENLFALKPEFENVFIYPVAGVVSGGALNLEELKDYNLYEMNFTISRKTIPNIKYAQHNTIKKCNIIYIWGIFRSILPKL